MKGSRRFVIGVTLVFLIALAIVLALAAPVMTDLTACGRAGGEIYSGHQWDNGVITSDVWGCSLPDGTLLWETVSPPCCR